MTLRLIDGKIGSPGDSHAAKTKGKDPSFDTCFTGRFKGEMRINRSEMVGGFSITFIGTDIKGDPLVEVEFGRKSFEVPCPIGKVIDAHGVRIKAESLGTHVLQADIGLVPGPLSETIIGDR